MCAFGVDLAKASGHHPRLCLVMSTLGYLRRKAADVSLRVSYTISGSIICFPSSSGEYIAYDLETQMEYIGLHVNVDSNMEAHAYIPAAVPALGVLPVDMLWEDYLLRFRAPSGGYLLAAPRFSHVPPRVVHLLGPGLPDGVLAGLS